MNIYFSFFFSYPFFSFETIVRIEVITYHIVNFDSLSIVIRNSLNDIVLCQDNYK